MHWYDSKLRQKAKNSCEKNVKVNDKTKNKYFIKLHFNETFSLSFSNSEKYFFKLMNNVDFGKL